LKSNYFASCPRGLEGLLVKELEALKIDAPKQVDGGVEFSCSMEQMYRNKITSRVATRVMMRIKKGTYETEEDLYRAALEIDWSEHFDISNSIKLSTTGVKCPLKSLDFMTLRIKDAVCDSFRKKMNKRPNVDIRNPDIRIHLFLEKNQYFIYLDTSGNPLYQRGFRKSSVEAPIKENLAAGIILLSGWEPGQAMLDPMCGSGTFLIEASMMALNQMPGLRRNFGFENWKNIDRKLLNKIKSTYESQKKPLAFSRIYGSDKDLRAIRVAKRNLVEAGLEEAVQLVCKKITEITPPFDEGVMITNPPYGIRIGEDEELAEAYPLWASCLKNKFSGWRTYFLTSDFRLPKLMRLSPTKKTPLFNGALDCRLFEIKMVAGSNRKK